MVPDISAPLVQGDHVIGVIECGPKVEGSYEPADQELLSTLGRQAAMAIHNSLLSAELSDRLEELAASRVRLVQAEEAGRRRLERDLHDGVQLKRDPRLAETTLLAVQQDAQRALEDL